MPPLPSLKVFPGESSTGFCAAKSPRGVPAASESDCAPDTHGTGYSLGGIRDWEWLNGAGGTGWAQEEEGNGCVWSGVSGVQWVRGCYRMQCNGGAMGEVGVQRELQGGEMRRLEGCNGKVNWGKTGRQRGCKEGWNGNKRRRKEGGRQGRGGIGSGVQCSVTGGKRRQREAERSKEDKSGCNGGTKGVQRGAEGLARGRDWVQWGERGCSGVQKG